MLGFEFVQSWAPTFNVRLGVALYSEIAVRTIAVSIAQQQSGHFMC